MQGLANGLAVHVRIAVHVAADPGTEVQDARYIELFRGNGKGLGQRRLDFFVKERHDAVEDVDQIKEHVLALVDHRQAFTGMLFGLPDAGDLEPHARPQGIQFGGGRGRIQPIEQVVRDVLLLAQDRAPGGFGRMPREHRLDAHGGDQFQCLLQRHSVALQSRDAIRDAAGLRGARIVEILPAPANSMDLLRRVHGLEPNRKRTRQIGRCRRRSVHRALLQLGPVRGIALAPLNCREPIAFHELEKFLAPLVAKRLADQGAEGMHVLAQRRILDGKLNALAIHNARLSRIQGEIL